MGEQAIEPIGTPGVCGGRFCLACDQSLLGVMLRRCPECGRGFDADDPATTALECGIHGETALVCPLRQLRKAWLTPSPHAVEEAQIAR